ALRGAAGGRFAGLGPGGAHVGRQVGDEVVAADGARVRLGALGQQSQPGGGGGVGGLVGAVGVDVVAGVGGEEGGDLVEIRALAFGSGEGVGGFRRQEVVRYVAAVVDDTFAVGESALQPGRRGGRV